MKTSRRKFSAQQKVQILRQHLVEKAPISEVCEKNGIQPTQFYQWQKVFFENGAAAFEKSPNKRNGIRNNKLPAYAGPERRDPGVINDAPVGRLTVYKSGS